MLLRADVCLIRSDLLDVHVVLGFAGAVIGAAVRHIEIEAMLLQTSSFCCSMRRKTCS